MQTSAAATPSGSTPPPRTLTLRRPDDWHLHIRDGGIMRHVVPDSARQFARAIIMPNLKPPVRTTADAQAYRDRILSALADADGAAAAFQPLMTLYLTPDTTPDEVRRAKESGIVHGVKLYPAGATTNSDAGVTDILTQCRPALEAMQACDMPLLVHGEATDPAIDVFDREAVFIEQVMQPLRRDFPALKIVFEHLTTADAVAFVREAPEPIAATITPQHLLYNRNALFEGGMRPHRYCLPVLKREKHRAALVDAATNGNPRFFLGTDSAPHPKHAKESDCGCAGCYTAPHALALYATVFDAAGQLDNLEAFASLNGPAFYGLPANTDTITLERSEHQIPKSLPLADSEIVPLAAGETLAWRLRAGD